MLHSVSAIYLLCMVLTLEGLSGWLLPAVTRRYFGKGNEVTVAAGNAHCSPESQSECGIPFSAERMFRFILVTFLIVSVQLFPEILWWMPWFVGFALIGAGLSGICPMVMALRWLGFR